MEEELNCQLRVRFPNHPATSSSMALKITCTEMSSRHRTLTHVYIFESHSAQTRLITYDRPYSTELQGFQDKSTPLEWFRYVIVHSLVMSPSFCDHLMEWAGKHLKKCDVTDKTIRLTETRSKHKK